MTRRCSHCSNNGHNSRTCPSRGGGVRLFGVRLTDGSIMKKSASMGNLSALYHSSSPAAVSPNPSSPATSDPVEGYLSDDPSAKRRADRKKGTPWTEEEHRLFLVGLKHLGKGDWRGIARTYVLSRTPTQVASHAQKYFIRQCSVTRRKRRSSLFDMAPETAEEPPDDHFMLPPAVGGTEHSDNAQCSLKLSLKPDSDESMEPDVSEIKHEVKEESSMAVSELPPIIPAFYPAYIPVPFPVWPSTMTPLEEVNNKGGGNESHHRVVKPIPILKKEPLNLDELVGMSSQLTLKDKTTDQHHHMEPSPLSLKLLAEPSRQSAFHASSGGNKRDGNAFRAI
ncbi:hypothetical protein L2E82_16589 [Cichorium intybus]|uniref:Uncharacterized protein n=1 Tax=Cichorium intybus TaxID=13427 RepID=A0ACB9F6H7_CICIN|nr:hypothetical protein L2E82_16589 [Cichorium intybus]